MVLVLVLGIVVIVLVIVVIAVGVGEGVVRVIFIRGEESHHRFSLCRFGMIHAIGGYLGSMKVYFLYIVNAFNFSHVSSSAEKAIVSSGCTCP